MPVETIFLVALFAISMVGSPGPANMALMASGARYGYSRSVPFLFGTLSGFLLVGIGVAAGVGTLFANFPALRYTFLVFSAAYILFLAYKIAFQSTKPGEKKIEPRYLAGCIVHPLNPKAWVMLVAAFSQFMDPTGAQIVQTMIILTVFTVTGLTLNSLWVFAGSLLTRFVSSPIVLQTINRTLAILMIIVVAVAMLRSGILG
ncbi:MAG: LysE family translocator [Sneathiellales bacterium]|nr:LysE family translocator [Sneathiellales bacterium]